MKTPPAAQGRHHPRPHGRGRRASAVRRRPPAPLWARVDQGAALGASPSARSAVRAPWGKRSYGVQGPLAASFSSQTPIVRPGWPASGLAPLRQRQELLLGEHRHAQLGGLLRLLAAALAPDGTVWVIEANPNPDLAHDEDFSRSAQAAGMEYPELIQRILNLGLAWRPLWKR